VNREIVQQITGQLGHLRPMSQWSLGAGLMAVDTDGIGGHIVIHIPTKSTDLVDITFVAGKARLVVEAA
jgi:hypothetical protein